MGNENDIITLVLGASTNPSRYAYLAIKSLRERNFKVLAVGLRTGQVDDVQILTGTPDFDDVDTITLYIGPRHQPQLYDYILKLKPRRVIFNPGTENPELFALLRNNGIDVEVACTLVLLSSKQYA